MSTAGHELVLASGSPYRRELLGRLGLAFRVASADVDEHARAGESPLEQACRLARDKAQAVAAGAPGTWVIGADQVAECEGERLGKPGDAERAARQLRGCSGRPVRFHTAVCLARAGDPRVREHCDLTVAWFRPLDQAEIDRYLAAEAPWDCAGSFKCEGLGICLFERIRSEDPTALIGLPLIALSRMLREAGFELP